MPWTSKSAPKKVRGKKRRRQWAKIANQCLEKGRSEGDCKRVASGVLKAQRKSK